MKTKIALLTIASTTLLLSSCGRDIRVAQDITPGNAKETQLDWKYGANDIRIQTTNITRELLNRWYARTGYDFAASGKPRITITQVDNRTDCFISTDMIRDIIEGFAVDDGRVSIVVGDAQDRKELDALMDHVQDSPKYDNPSRIPANSSLCPEFLAKIRLTKAITQQKKFDIEDWRMTITLYDVKTQEALDSAWDVLRKKVEVN